VTSSVGNSYRMTVMTVVALVGFPVVLAFQGCNGRPGG
jgi:hypothetical protein